MQANSVNFIRDILHNRRFYYIPVYQRNYSWQEEQCKQLFDDIMKLYTREYEDHFIGTIVWKPDTGNSANLSVIDGQQRLTTSFLLILAMRAVTNNEGLIKELTEIVVDSYENKVRLIPIKSDNEVFSKLVRGEADEVINKSSRMYANYMYFIERLTALDCDLNDVYLSLSGLSAIKMELDYRDNPQIIFESINSTGLSISIADLIRNYLLMNEPYEMQTYLFEKYWYKFEQKLGTENLVLFFEHYLNIKVSEQNISRSNMYSHFKDYFNSNNFTAESLLVTLAPYIDVYAFLSDGDKSFKGENTKISKSITKLKNELLEIDNKTVRMYLLPTVNRLQLI